MTWSNWNNLGGICVSAPAAVSWSDNRIDAFVIDTGNSISHIAWDGFHWSQWVNLGGDCRYGVGAASWASNRLDIFTIDIAGSLNHKAWDGAWHDWMNLGGQFISAPTAVSWGENRIDVFAIGGDNATYHIAWDSGWSAWNSLAGDCRYGVGAASWAPGRLDVFTIDTAGSLNHKAWSESAVPGVPGTPSTPNAQAQELLDAHNRYRSEVGVPPLQWSDSLAADAQPWANYLASLGGFTLIHSNTNGQGENLFVGTSGAFGYTRMVDDWGNERQSFVPGLSTGVGFDGNPVGHYTQVIWRSTTHVGCAIATSGDGNDFLVCRYSPQGNVDGQYVP